MSAVGYDRLERVCAFSDRDVPQFNLRPRSGRWWQMHCKLAMMLEHNQHMWHINTVNIGNDPALKPLKTCTGFSRQLPRSSVEIRQEHQGSNKLSTEPAFWGIFWDIFRYRNVRKRTYCFEMFWQFDRIIISKRESWPLHGSKFAWLVSVVRSLLSELASELHEYDAHQCYAHLNSEDVHSPETSWNIIFRHVDA